MMDGRLQDGSKGDNELHVIGISDGASQVAIIRAGEIREGSQGIMGSSLNP